jgi:hypothetical protein
MDQIAALKTRISALKSRSVAIIVNTSQAEAAVRRINAMLRTTSGAHVSIGGVGSGISARAGGGPVRAGSPYIVGERRPELFVPNQNGRIEPSVPSGGGVSPEMARLIGQEVGRAVTQVMGALVSGQTRAGDLQRRYAT